MINILKHNPKILKSINTVEYALLIAIIFVLPYWGLLKYFKHFVSILFILTLVSGQLDLKNLLKEKVVIVLFSFIIFTYLSALWTEGPLEITRELHLNFDRFKYYFLLIPAVYSLSLGKKQIQNLFFLMALAPFITVIIYYCNGFGITHIYSQLFFHGNTNFITHYLINNPFIVYSALYFYILIFESFKQHNFKKAFLYTCITAVLFVSLFIDSGSTSRLMLVVFFLLAMIIPFFYLNKRNLFLVLFITLGISLFFISTNSKMQKGIQTFKTAESQGVYSGSWGHRLGFAIVGLKIFEENPWFGRGIIDVREKTIQYAKEHPKYFIGDHNRHFHDEHINILVEVGIVGYLIFIIFIILFLRLHINNTFINNLKISVILFYLLLMFGEHYLTIKQATYFFALFIGLMLSYHKTIDTHADL